MPDIHDRAKRCRERCISLLEQQKLPSDSAENEAIDLVIAELRAANPAPPDHAPRLRDRHSTYA